MSDSYRDQFSPVIAGVLAKCAGQTVNQKRAALRAAWNYGPRQYHPYKIWLDEARIQMGLKRVKCRKLLPRTVATRRESGRGQKEMFTQGSE